MAIWLPYQMPLLVIFQKQQVLSYRDVNEIKHIDYVLNILLSL